MAPAADPLLSRLRAGDAAALAELLEQKRKPLLAFIERQMGPNLRARLEPLDIFQEVSLSALNGLAGADLAMRDPFNWLCHLAEQRIIDAHRKHFGTQKRTADREQPLEAPANPDTSQALIDLLAASMTTASQVFSRDQKQLRLARAMNELPAEARDALQLRYGDGLPTKEIAARLGKTDGAVRVLLTRSLQRLQEILNPK